VPDRPRIAVTAIPRVVPTAYGRRDADTVERNLVRGVVDAGGVPLVLPVTPPALAAGQLGGVDALILSGGQDLDAELFGGTRHPASTWLDPDRDRHEVALFHAARASEIPVLGICRGLQLAAAATGGRLAPHIEGHDAGERYREVRHPVRLDGPSALRSALGDVDVDELVVNTIHHQAVDAAPAAWRVVARADDGTIEATEATDGAWLLGVQWHPELILDEPAGQALFDALAAAAR
jgi:putative glutamine amidotransferase